MWKRVPLLGKYINIYYANQLEHQTKCKQVGDSCWYFLSLPNTVQLMLYMLGISSATAHFTMLCHFCLMVRVCRTVLAAYLLHLFLLSCITYAVQIHTLAPNMFKIKYQKIWATNNQAERKHVNPWSRTILFVKDFADENTRLNTINFQNDTCMKPIIHK